MSTEQIDENTNPDHTTDICLGGDLFDDLPAFESTALPEMMTISLPLPSFGSTQSHFDLCIDLVNAAYAADLIGQNGKIEGVDFVEAGYRAHYTLTVVPTSGIWNALKRCETLFLGGDDEIEEAWETNIIDEISAATDYEDDIDTRLHAVPEIVDHYYMNLIHGVYHDSEHEELTRRDLQNFPERKIGYCRSAVSPLIGADCFVSTDRWAVPSGLDLDKFFEAANEKYRLDQFEPSHQHIRGDRVYEFTGRTAVSFDWADLARCRDVSSHLLECRKPAHRKNSRWPSNPVARERCLLHETGSAALIDDGHFVHIFFWPTRLTGTEAEALASELGHRAATAADILGPDASVTLPWHTLNDEKFEALCYDLLIIDPRFDENTIRKMGKTTSRDGGRDIVIDAKRRAGQKRRKWIFQCKLIRDGSSLTPSKVPNIGDMLEQYDANGFGLMTSAVIDATLHDRTEALCQRRGIEESHFSVFELERRLWRNPVLKMRYF